MEALLVEAGYRDAFCAGLFRCYVQRIYADGKSAGEAIPPEWAKPRKRMDHRYADAGYQPDQ